MQSLSSKRSETRKISHNPEVSGSNPLPATTKTLAILQVSFFRVLQKHHTQTAQAGHATAQLAGNILMGAGPLSKYAFRLVKLC